MLHYCRLALFALTISMMICLPALADPPATVRFARRCLMVTPNEGCDVADVNRDGTLDIIAGTHWFAGPDFAARPIREIPEVSSEFLANNGDHAYDLNGDGWVDVISADWLTSEIHWYENPGKAALEKGLKWKEHLLKDTRAENEAIELRDFDSDGVPELYVSCWIKGDPQVVWKLAKGPDDEPTIERIILGQQGGGHGYGFGDINGDGREDVLTEIGWYERPEGPVFVGPWKFHAETALPHPSCPCLILDVDGDGRNDILWGKAHDFGLYWWQQGQPTGDGTTTWTEHLIDDSWSQAHALAWADLDGDGKCELITGKRVRGHAGGDPGGKEPACLYYYTWDAQAGKFHRHTISPPGGGVGAGMQIRVVDLNTDGRLDIAVAGKTGTWVLINKGAGH